MKRLAIFILATALMVAPFAVGFNSVAEAKPIVVISVYER